MPSATALSPASTGPAADSAARWEVWGTYAFLAVSDGDRLAAARRTAEQVLDLVDRACSRFRPDSDLSEVNRNPGRWVRVDPLLVAATRVAVTAAEHSDGLVDPCLGRTMVSLGYDVDLAELTSRPAPLPAVLATHRPDAWRDVAWTEDALRIPADVALDLGATAKAWAADVIATLVAEQHGCLSVVSLGGDLRVVGPDGDASTWPVRVAEHPADVASGVEVHVSGGLATSSTVVRRWRGADGDLHHLVDPRTGRPVVEAYRTVTAAGDSCVGANTASTAALVLGDDAPRWLAERGVTARLVGADGTVTTVGAWPEPPGDDGAAAPRSDDPSHLAREAR